MEIIEIIIKSVAAGVAAAGFGILFNVPQRTISPIFILGAAGGLVKFGTMHFGTGIVFASFLAAIMIGILSIRMAHFKNSPPLVFYIPSVIPLVPGFFIYKMMLGIMSLSNITDNNLYIDNLINTVNFGVKATFILISLGIGVAAPMLITRKETVKKKNPKPIVATADETIQKKMKKSLFLILLLSVAPGIRAQTLTDSNLPIVVINTDINLATGQPTYIPDEPKVGAVMKIILRPDGGRNFISDQSNTAFLNYSGRIGIEIRGSSSQTLPKKPYGLTTFLNDKVTKNNVAILGMPEEHDWVLNSIAFDPSLIRNYLSYYLMRSIGNYAARGVFCEVVINGEYKGIYIFMEKLKIDKNRTDIVKIENTDNSGVLLTGGYVTKADKTTGGDPVAWTMQSYNGSTKYIHEDPDQNEITSQQNSYIQSQFNNLQKTATAQNTSVINGFPSVIDIPSFVDFILLSELTSNADSYQYSTYFHKDRNGKLRAGPIWDYDLTYGNDLFHWGYDRSHTDVWQFSTGNSGSKFWKDLYNNSTFKCYLIKRWKELNITGGSLNYSEIIKRMDEYVSLISEAKVRENARWGTIPDHAREIENMKSWIQLRINWLNSMLGGYSACTNPPLPSLVISKINYHPGVAKDLESSDYEFIEITNTGTQTVNLSGIYMRELGIGYQFPANSTLGAGKRLLLAGNSSKFTGHYGIAPFGEYTRELSNNSEKIVLADAFGNVIDSVRYSDSIPWPEQADGTGFFLQLADLKSDNSLAENWVAAADIMTGISSKTLANSLLVYPNPTHSKIKIESQATTVEAFWVTDLSGRILISDSGNFGNSFTINLNEFSTGFYFLKLITSEKTTTTYKINKL